ncbi:Asp-tRNA(Asn)/Glu-tRNA(Gln) amidotransferase subunit GatB, partial [bacterium]|nr:Asp-tRNA(Asn)/Glu-tRNA(Gln) amidotransferase subunit GatB [bacterium]
MKNPYQVKIGMEIHSEIKTKRKMFCFCPNNPFEVKANTNVCPICLAHPGTLPIINKKAIEMVILASQALNCQIAKITKFDRKNYFYPDLPKGYQISQYDLPIGFNGFLPLKEKKIRIRRIHLEEDAGKLIHPQGKNYSLVDFNRAGVPLLELVSEPDIESAKEAKEFCQELQRVFRYLEISDADLEKGQMRCEVNISLTKNNSLGTKVEIKNLGSFKAVEQAIEYEIKRQRKLLVKGEKIKQETRGWDKEKGITYPQRS